MTAFVMLENRVATGTMTQWMRRILQGGQEADADLWVGLAHRSSRYVYTILRKLGLSHDQAEEGCAEVLCRLIDSIKKGNYNPAKGLRSYLWGIARNVRNKMLRHQMREEKHKDKRQFKDGDLSHIKDSGLEPPDQAMENQEEARIAREKALQKLIHDTALSCLREKTHHGGKEKQYSAFVAYHRQGTKLAEIARQYKENESTVRSWNHRMKVEYGECLAEAYRFIFGDRASQEWQLRSPKTPMGAPGDPPPDTETSSRSGANGGGQRPAMIAVSCNGGPDKCNSRGEGIS